MSVHFVVYRITYNLLFFCPWLVCHRRSADRSLPPFYPVRSFVLSRRTNRISRPYIWFPSSPSSRCESATGNVARTHGPRCDTKEWPDVYRGNKSPDRENNMCVSCMHVRQSARASCKMDMYAFLKFGRRVVEINIIDQLVCRTYRQASETDICVTTCEID